jgi:SAM-dependent methyltransferase
MDYLISLNIYKNDSTIVEVGCGKGFYIDILSNKLERCSFFGFDTSYDGILSFPEKNITYFRSYYPNKSLTKKPNIIINRHVIEHISDPIYFLKSIRSTLDLNSYLFLETPDFNWIINNSTLFDIFYEHCNYWLPISISKALEISGFQVVDISVGFEGQYLCVVAKAVDESLIDISYQSILTIDLYKHFFSLSSIFLESLKKIYSLKRKIALWGSGAKGCSFVCNFDPNRLYIACLIDINPKKQNRYVGKTGHQIIAPSDISSNHIDFIIVLNSNYEKEIKFWLFNNNLSYIDVVNVSDLLAK